MFRKFVSRTSFVPALLLSLSACMLGCNGRTNDPIDEHSVDITVGTIVYHTDSTEWKVCIFRLGVHASDNMSVPAPYHIPTHEEAKLLRRISYGEKGQRYLTDDGYTFGMPSASVSKAGSKTTYGLMGLYIRPTTIYIEF